MGKSRRHLVACGFFVRCQGRRGYGCGCGNWVNCGNWISCGNWVNWVTGLTASTASIASIAVTAVTAETALTEVTEVTVVTRQCFRSFRLRHASASIAVSATIAGVVRLDALLVKTDSLWRDYRTEIT
jgi:hypothetical protein